MQLKCYLRDLSTDLVKAWQHYFADIAAVEIAAGEVFGVSADAIIRPANSFGFMDGGIDLVYSQRFGWHVQERVQSVIRDEHGGELAVGLAVMVRTDDESIPFCISAPTMRAPSPVADTLNAYLAFRAALRAIKKVNEWHPNTIGSVICPGMATATGQMEPMVCAKQMHAAWMQEVEGQVWEATSINEIINEHYRLLRT
jgi:O-acetyl-ADP-ribose deacetylase (regulator of RNase III)